jgi:hypothetical protein
MPLGKRPEFGDARYAGVDMPYAHNIAEHMQVRWCARILAAAVAAASSRYGHPSFDHEL